MMRKRAAKWVFRVLAVFLIAAFGLWGINDYVRPMRTPETVATIGDITVTVRDLSQEYRRALNRLRSSLGPSFDPQAAQRLGLADRALDQMINDRLYHLEARRLGITVPDGLVVAQLHREPAFQDQFGKFDRRVFDLVLSQNDMNEDYFVATIRDQMARSQLTDALTAGLTVPAPLVEAVYRYRNERRVADVVSIPFSNEAVPEPTDAELAAFHEANRELFSRPEMREVTVVTIDPDAIARDLKPSEARLREEYESRKAALSIPERRTIRLVFGRDEAAIRAAADALKGGADLEAAAAAAGDGKADVVSLGAVTRAEVPIKELADAAFAQPAGQPGPPIPSPLGWHIVVVDGIEPGRTPTFEETREELAQSVASEEAIEAAVKTANSLEDTLAGGATLDDAAARLNLPILSKLLIDAQGHDADNRPVPGLPGGSVFLRTVFELESGQASSLRETDGGGFFMARVDRIEPRALRPLDQVRDAAVAAWKRSEREARARRAAEALAAKAGPEKPLAAAASAEDLKAVTSKPFARFSLEPDAGVPAALAAALFRVKPGETATAQGEDVHYVGQLIRIVEADPAADQAGRERVRAGLLQSMGDEILQQYAEDLRARFGVKVNRAAVAQVYPSNQ